MVGDLLTVVAKGSVLLCCLSCRKHASMGSRVKSSTKMFFGSGKKKPECREWQVADHPPQESGH